MTGGGGRGFSGATENISSLRSQVVGISAPGISLSRFVENKLASTPQCGQMSCLDSQVTVQKEIDSFINGLT